MDFGFAFTSGDLSNGRKKKKQRAPPGLPPIPVGDAAADLRNDTGDYVQAKKRRESIFPDPAKSCPESKKQENGSR